MAAQGTVAIAIRWGNDVVMCFGWDGEEILELRGPYQDVAPCVLAAATPETTFERGTWRDNTTRRVTPEGW